MSDTGLECSESRSEALLLRDMLLRDMLLWDTLLRDMLLRNRVSASHNMSAYTISNTW